MINENLRARMADHGSNAFNLGRWYWVKIEGKDNECTVFISTYRPCKNTACINSVWNQQVRFFQREDWRQDLGILDNFCFTTPITR